jgi:uncharacterized protein (DUF2062 family)
MRPDLSSVKLEADRGDKMGSCSQQRSCREEQRSASSLAWRAESPHSSIVGERERAFTVFAALVPLAIAVALVLAELISGNP